MLEVIKEKFTDLLWNTNLKDVNKIQSILIQALRVLYGASRDLSSGLLSLRAMGLVYTTLLSLVPLIAVSFSVLKGFGIHNQLKPALTNLLEPLGEKGILVSQQIISFVDNMKVGVLGSIGLLFLIFTVLSLVKKIESAFNYTWRITVTRNFFQRFSNYLSVILIGPLLLFTAAGLTASFNSSVVVNNIISIEPFGTILLLIGEITPFILTIITFTLIYILIPNTKVRFKSAFYGAVAATILWKLTGVMFTAFIVDSTNYTAIYSGFAIMIILMLWIHLSWLIVLTGASVAYYHQNPDRISSQSQIIRLSSRLREKLALTVMQLIATNFDNNDVKWTLKSLSEKTNISESALMIIMPSLQKNGLLTTTGKNGKHFMPNQSLEHITVEMILNAARSAEETPKLRPEDVNADEHVENIITSLELSLAETTKNKTLKDLV